METSNLQLATLGELNNEGVFESKSELKNSI